MEYYRRWLLFIGIVLGVWLYFFTYITSYYQVSLYDALREQTRAQKKSIFDTELSYINSLPINEYIKEITKNKLYVKNSDEWINFFSLLKEDKISNILHKYRSEYGNLYYFRDTYSPISELKDKFTKNNNEIFIQLPNDSNLLIKIKYETPSYSDFSFYSYPKINIFYPFRNISFIIFFIGLIGYVFLPYTKREEYEFYYDRWRIIIGDFVAFLLFSMFFVIPFIVLGSSQIVLLSPLSYLFWLPLIPAVYLIFMQMKMGSFSIKVLDDRFLVSTYKGEISYEYSDIYSYNEVILQPPKWLKIMSSISLRTRMLITPYNAIKINFKNDRSLYLNNFGYFNQRIAKGFDNVLSLLEKKQIPLKEPEIIEKMGFVIGSYDPEIKYLIKNKIIKKKYFGLISVFLIVLFVVFGLVEFYFHLVPEKLPIEKVVYATNKLPYKIEIEKSFGDGERVREGNKILMDKQSNIYLIGEERFFNINNVQSNLIVVKLDNEGNKLIEKKFEKEGVSHNYQFAVFNNNIFIIGKLGESVSFIVLDTSLNKIYEKSYEIKNLNCICYNLKFMSGGYELSFIWQAINGLKYLVKLKTDKNGNKINEKIINIDLSEEIKIVKIAKIDKGFLIGGIIKTKGKFDDIVVSRYNDEGKKIFEKVIGGKKPDKLCSVIELKNGEFVIFGSTRSFSDNEDLYLVRLNSAGNIISEKNYGSYDDEIGVDIQQLNNDKIVAVGLSKAKNTSYYRSYISILDHNLKLIEDGYMGDTYDDTNNNRDSYSINNIYCISDDELLLTGSKDKYYFSGIEKTLLFIKLKKEK